MGRVGCEAGMINQLDKYRYVVEILLSIGYGWDRGG
jgi:hypothetical protein